jgi:hypothetical protein
MQSSLTKSVSAAQGGIAPVNISKKQDAVSAKEDNKNGFIIIKKGEGVFYIRYDIIFAKAGDVFFMPRKVPDNFSLDTDKVIPFNATAGEFEKFYDDNFHPVKRDEIKRFATLAASLQ